ncbi:MAG TPA: hypothetical protein PKA06_16395, partial [Gemmatales bacterium]|nr:hypothetical protein [Gemmatales bacterium]
MSLEHSPESLQGSTPSRLITQTPNWVRLVGLVGMVMVLAGLAMYAWNMWKYMGLENIDNLSPAEQQRTKIYPLAVPFFLLGILAMLFQAGQEKDQNQRRFLGLFGICFFSLGLLFATHVYVSEAVQYWLSSEEGSNLESAASKGKWAGLAGSLVMGLILLIAWVAPFVRAVSETRVSLLGFGAAW